MALPEVLLSPLDALALQRAAGNRAVASAVRVPLQRVGIKEDPKTETLYNKTNASGEATAKKYTMHPRYQMVRNGDTGVTVTIAIKFLNQARNTVDPADPASPPGTPPLGTLLGDPTEIPGGDERRGWAEGIAKEAATVWSGTGITLLGEEWNLWSKNTKKRLPVTFTSKAVYGVGDDADATVIVHPATVVADPDKGHPIDAGNWYKNKGAYSGDEKIIAAHEYGHLLGIPDEYSQSNEQLNALLHQAAPGSAPSVSAALDRATVERMVLAALRQPLYDQLDTALPTVTDAIRAARPQVKKRMADAAKAGVTSADVHTALENQLAAASETALGPRIARVVTFQVTKNFSNRALAGEGVEAGFSAVALGKQIKDAYWKALVDAGSGTVAVAGLGDVSINVKGSVTATTKAGGAQAAPAAGVATSAVGPGATPGLPAIAPSASLIAQISALPATWSAAGAALEAGVNGMVFATKMAETLRRAAGAVAAPPPGVAPAKKIALEGALYRAAHKLVSNAAREAARQTAAEHVDKAIKPVLSTSVADLSTKISEEVARVMKTTPAGVPALGTPDPNMTALVNAMKTRLEADKTETKGTGRDPLGAGKAAPAQDVTYSYQGLMGSSKTQAIRPDQLAALVGHFNAKLKTTFEKAFTVEVKK
jgi:hypothetical protein